MDVAVIVGTFGDESWIERSRTALESAKKQNPAELLGVHASTLAQARNEGAARTSAEWLCFLDADDQLEPGYLEAMAEAERPDALLAPAVRYVQDDFIGAAMVLSDRDIARVNPCVIGTLIRRDRFFEVGQFWEERAWEDWSLFRRAWLLGDTVHHVPAAIYRANVNPNGRNNVPRGDQLHRQIINRHRAWHRRRTRT